MDKFELENQVILIAENISKTFIEPENLTIFKNLSLEVKRGEFVALVGHSGCGKSTLLRTLAGLEKADEGGKITVIDSRGKHPVGVVFQHPALLPWRTVRQNILISSELLRKPELENSVDDILRLFGLEKFASYFPQQISGGMQSRTAIACAVLPSPSILLMDEPFGALDEFTRANLQEDLMEIWERLETSIFFVTHSIEEAVLLSDRVLIMQGHPCTHLQKIKINLPRPRSQNNLKDPTFIKYLWDIRSILMEG